MMPLILHLPEVKKEGKIGLEHVHDIGYVHGVVKTAISVNTGELKGAPWRRRWRIGCVNCLPMWRGLRIGKSPVSQ
jgi:hypothetical protein